MACCIIESQSYGELVPGISPVNVSLGVKDQGHIIGCRYGAVQTIRNAEFTNFDTSFPMSRSLTIL